MLSVRAVFKPRNDLGRYASVVISPAVSAAVQQACELIQEKAQGFCPVDTGALQASITIDPLDDQGKTIIGRVGPHMFYAPFVEFGSGVRGAASPGAGPGPYSENWPGAAAQPFMRPAVDESKEQVLEIFRNNLEVAIA
jgi:HK97 gp10 family phage protein